MKTFLVVIMALLLLLICITTYGSYYAWQSYESAALAAAFEKQAMKDRVHNTYPCK